jgi:predicted ArsR family transcriptional regulator
MAGRRDEVLATLRAASTPLSIIEVAERLSIHPNTARFHLEALTKIGRVESVEPERSKPGRPPLMFRTAPGMDPAGHREYRLLAGILTEAIASRPEAAVDGAAAGRLWAERHTSGSTVTDKRQAIRRLTDLLAELGFSPKKRSGTAGVEEIGLHNCPFLELAAVRRDVVCPVHLGLMQGAMAAWNAPLTVDSLTPFVQPDMCVARLAPVTESR